MALVSVGDYHRRAAEILPPIALEYFQGAADRAQTRALNRTAYDRIRIRPRVLMNVVNRQLGFSILGLPFDMPLGISPTALQRLAHGEGEVATARAAQAMRVPYVMSMFASSSIEGVARAAPDGTKWIQLYLYKNRQISEAVVRRAEKAGFRAIVLTIDSPVSGLVRGQIRESLKFPDGIQLEIFRSLVDEGIIERVELSDVVGFDPALTWRDVEWLKSITLLPVIVKGVLTREDALKAIQIGVDAIMVSNHGGRQLDSVSATIDVLPEIVSSVRGRVPIIIDGGIERGIDVFKALAIGANMVFIGRAAVWGLAVAGQNGVEEILRRISLELDNTMALAGCPTIADITKDRIQHATEHCEEI
ncbi:uncharacterized protein LOC129766244 [Toxorhynchites rutilus septentrionalis]|uniref:uncharacterized protein LOC129766244 n=1 Tax=Toxorhynchites rutilus septentrionalis TaxID=329112 RepID=UPI002479968B|nr:uncharacterized protein LOC129766244 [Toxorhynchites rutilus septentrionalis]